MTRLGCNYNELTQLDVSKNVNLVQIVCNNNKLTELDLSNNKLLRDVACGTQISETLKIKATDQGYEINLKDYVQKIENIDVSSIKTNNGYLISYDGETGIVIFNVCPDEVYYTYNTRSPNNDLMYVTLKPSMTIDVIEW